MVMLPQLIPMLTPTLLLLRAVAAADGLPPPCSVLHVAPTDGGKLVDGPRANGSAGAPFRSVHSAAAAAAAILTTGGGFRTAMVGCPTTILLQRCRLSFSHAGRVHCLAGRTLIAIYLAGASTCLEGIP
eukprot:SAG31_NODE_982_length_10556_cov_18.203883_5_plen_129_part_00